MDALGCQGHRDWATCQQGAHATGRKHADEVEEIVAQCHLVVGSSLGRNLDVRKAPQFPPTASAGFCTPGHRCTSHPSWIARCAAVRRFFTHDSLSFSL